MSRDWWRWLSIDRGSGRIQDPSPRDIAVTPLEHKSGWVLTADEKRQGFLRPLRLAYEHLACGGTTTLGERAAAILARDPFSFKNAYCEHCRAQFPVGHGGAFVWKGSSEKVGT